MNGRMDPPPTTPIGPTGPRPSKDRGPLIGLVVMLAVAAICIGAFLYYRGGIGGGGRAGGETVAVPEEMGGHIAIAKVNQLLDEARAGDLNDLGVRLAVGQPDEEPVYRVGDRLRVGFSAGSPAYCALLHRNARGVITLQYPQTGEHAAVETDDPWISEGFEITPPLGDESFLLVCMPRDRAKAPANLDEILDGKPDSWAEKVSLMRKDYEVKDAR